MSSKTWQELPTQPPLLTVCWSLESASISTGAGVLLLQGCGCDCAEHRLDCLLGLPGEEREHGPFFFLHDLPLGLRKVY